MSQTLPVDIIGHLIQFFSLPSLGGLASTCRLYDPEFVWSRVKEIPIELSEAPSRRETTLLDKLVLHKARIESFNMNRNVSKRIEAIFQNSLHFIRRLQVTAPNYIRLLNNGSSLVALDTASWPETLSLLQTGCPNLESLSLVFLQPQSDVPKFIPVLTNLPKLRFLAINSVLTLEVVSQIGRALAGRLERLDLVGLSFRAIFRLGHLDILKLSVDEVESYFLAQFGISSTRLVLHMGPFERVVHMFLLEGLHRGLFEEIAHEVDTGDPSHNTNRSAFLAKATRYLEMTAQFNINMAVQCLTYFIEKCFVFAPADWALRAVSSVLLEDNRHVPQARCCDTKELATCVYLIFRRLERWDFPGVSGLRESFANSVRTYMEQYNRYFLPTLLQSGPRPCALGLAESLLGDPIWAMNFNFDPNMLIQVRPSEWEPLIVTFAPSAALLLFRYDSFDPTIVVNGKSVVLSWIFKMENEAYRQQGHRAAAEVPVDIPERRLVSRLMQWFSDHLDRLPCLIEVLLLFQQKVSPVWMTLCLAEFLPVLRHLPRDQVLQLVPTICDFVQDLKSITELINFLYKDVLGDAEVDPEAQDRVVLPHWHRALRSRDRNEFSVSISPLIQNYPIPKEILHLVENQNESTLETGLAKNEVVVIIRRDCNTHNVWLPSRKDHRRPAHSAHHHPQ